MTEENSSQENLWFETASFRMLLRKMGGFLLTVVGAKEDGWNKARMFDTVKRTAMFIATLGSIEDLKKFGAADRLTAILEELSRHELEIV
jgi:hypothetical protein